MPPLKLTRGHVPALTIMAGLLATSLGGCGQRAASSSAMGHEVAANAALGHHMIVVGGCNDCHTAGFLQRPVPESSWLTGNPVGFKGPWGVTYASNLRLTAQALDEDSWTQMLATRNGAPPMPWTTVHGMTDVEKRSIYQYLRSLGPAGGPAPTAAPPGEPVTTAYISMIPQVD